MTHQKITSSFLSPTTTRLCSLFALGCALSTVGCVSEARYEEARSAAQVEQEGHRRSATELSRVKKENQDLKSDIATREKTKALSEQEIAEAKLGMTVAVKEREAASDLVTQLRGELARVGDHLRTYSDEKRQLALALETAEAHARSLAEIERRSTALALVVRDVALILPEPIGAGEIELSVRDGEAQLRMPGARAFLPDGQALTPEATAMVSGLVKLSTLHGNVTFEATEIDPNVNPDPVARMNRLRALGDAFSASGLTAERLVIRVPNAARPAMPSAPEVPDAPAAAVSAVDAPASLPASPAVGTVDAPAAIPEQPAPMLSPDLVITIKL